MDKVWLVVQESNVDGEICFNPTPCVSKATAKELLKQEKATILKESYHFGGYDELSLNDMFEIEEDDERWFINDPCDDYYEELMIVEKDIQD